VSSFLKELSILCVAKSILHSQTFDTQCSYCILCSAIVDNMSSQARSAMSLPAHRAITYRATARKASPLHNAVQ
jgi:hypothetical protein